jgi:hypothetical protein
MDGSSVVGRFVLSTLVAISSSCTPFGTCSSHACQKLSIDRHAAGPESHITWDGQQLPLIDQPDRGRPPEGKCYANLEQTHADSDTAGTPPAFSQDFMAECSSNNAWLTMGGTLGDTRASDFAMKPLDMDGWIAQGMASGSCSFKPTGQKSVDASAGGPLAFPQLVTPNYERTFTVTGTVDQCATADFSFTFGTTAADFHGSPDGTCQDCGM